MSDSTVKADISMFENLQANANIQMGGKSLSPMAVFNESNRAFLTGAMSVFTFGASLGENDTAVSDENLTGFPKSDADALASDWQKVGKALQKVMSSADQKSI
jgi:hypothetical protein